MFRNLPYIVPYVTDKTKTISFNETTVTATKKHPIKWSYILTGISEYLFLVDL